MNKLLILTSYTKFLLQIERLMSDREMFGRADDLSVFLFREDEVGESKKRCPLTLNFDAKKIHEVKQSALLNCHILAPVKQ